MEKIAFEELCRLEPRLRALYDEARAAADDGAAESFCANDLWYAEGEFKARLCRLVGDGAGPREPRLRTSEAYDVAYEAAYDALPNCRNCSCW